MRIADMLGRSKPTISFEFMAPRDESEVEVLERTVATLAGHAPEALGEGLRVAVGAAWADLGAAAHRVPTRVGPLDPPPVAHAVPPPACLLV